MVDVTRVPENAFGYVPTPALVAPIEFTMRLADYAALGGHMDEVRPAVVAATPVPSREGAGRPAAGRPPPASAGRADRPRDRRRWPAGRGGRRLSRRGRAFRRVAGRALRRARLAPRSRRCAALPSRRAGGAPHAPAVAPFAGEAFITPMAAVAGAVAEEILAAMTAAAPLDRAYVNNGGDIALHLAPGETFALGLVDRPDRPSLFAATRIEAAMPVRGVATSGLARPQLLARHRRRRDRARRDRRQGRCRRDDDRQRRRPAGPSRRSGACRRAISSPTAISAPGW